MREITKFFKSTIFYDVMLYSLAKVIINSPCCVLSLFFTPEDGGS
jgi:hypothetical protein